MVSQRALVAGLCAAACGACTLVVENRLSSHADAGPGDAGPADCGEMPFYDGRDDGGGETFHQGVAQVRWHGPAFPPDGREPANFGSTLTFLADGGLVSASGAHDIVYMQDLRELHPTLAIPVGGHEAGGGYGCSELLAATYDPLHDRTSWRLVPGGCVDEEIFYDGGIPDGGTTSGPPEEQGAALGWVANLDGGTGMLAALYGGNGQSCREEIPFTCVPPKGAVVSLGGARSLDGLLDAQGRPVWAVTTFSAIGAGDTQLWPNDFLAPLSVVPWAGSITLMAQDVALAARITDGQLEALLFDSTGAQLAVATLIPVGDPGAHALQIARFGGTGTTAMATWIAGDGTARLGTLGISNPALVTLTGVKELCGSAGTTFVAPMSNGAVAVQAGESMVLRPAR